MANGGAASGALAAAVAAATEHGGAGVGSPLRRRASMFGEQDADRAEHDLTLEARERVEARRSAAATGEERREGSSERGWEIGKVFRGCGGPHARARARAARV